MYQPEKACAEMIKRLKQISRQKKLTTYSLAKLSGVSASTISYLFSGKTKPQIYTILLLCNALEIEIGSLFEAPNEARRSSGKIAAFHPQAKSCRPAPANQKRDTQEKEKALICLIRSLTEEEQRFLTSFAEFLKQNNSCHDVNK